MEAHISEVLSKLALIKDRLDPHKVMIVQYKIGQLYLRDGQTDKGIDFLNQILNHPGKYLRVDLQIYTRLSLIVAHYEQHNDIVTDYLVNTTQRFFQKQAKMNRTPELMLQLFRKITQLDPRRAKEEIQASLPAFDQLAEDRYERRAFIFLDIRPWLKSQISQRSTKEIVLESAPATT